MGLQELLQLNCFPCKINVYQGTADTSLFFLLLFCKAAEKLAGLFRIMKELADDFA